MNISPLIEHRAEFLVHSEVHRVILFLWDMDKWPLHGGFGPFVDSLEGEPRRWAKFVLEHADDQAFEPLASALEIATINFRREYED